ncbi:MAG: precorrin-3B C(17)-methyltransferase [Acidimicrobiales bacterium]
MKILSITLTARGAELARRLPWEHEHGALASTIRSRWADVDGFVVFAATGVAVRVVGPLLGDKDHDPAVVCVDEGGRWVVALCGGHSGGANDLANHVAALLGAEAVVTTATDSTGLPALDTIHGCHAVGDIAGVTTALLDGSPVWIDNRANWPLPAPLEARLGSVGADGPDIDAPGIVVTDESVAPHTSLVVIHPPSLIVGVGASTGAPAADLRQLVDGALGDAGLSALSVASIATLDRKRAEPAIVALADAWQVPIVDAPAEVLASVAVPTPSDVVRNAVGTPSVAEAAALTVGGPGAELLVPKRASATATVAVARRPVPRGHLSIVGIGPGGPQHRTPAATAAIRHADFVIGYGPYLDLAADAIAASAMVTRSPIGEETTRTKQALTEAAGGHRVALVCSGDAGVFALATLALELATEHPSLDPIGQIEIVPGVTAALAAASVLGAPLAHDHAAISLSDLLTPWPIIERRLRAAAESDLVVSLYNPRSAGRPWQLAAALAILGAHRPGLTPVGLVTNAGRADERAVVTTIGALDPEDVGMSTCVIVGASSTRVVGGRMVTPRGYER